MENFLFQDFNSFDLNHTYFGVIITNPTSGK